MPDDLDQLLDSYNATTLKAMAIAAEIIPPYGKTPSKGELMAKMKTSFFTAERVKKTLDKLDNRERAVLNRLQLHAGPISTRTFQRELVRAGVVSPPPTVEQPRKYGESHVAYAMPGDYVGSADRPKSSVFQDVIARLTRHGLVFSQLPSDYQYSSTQYKLQVHPCDTVFIPAAINRHLPPPTPVIADIQNWQPARIETGHPQALLRELYLYWDYVRRNDVALLQNGLVAKRALKALNQALLTPDPQMETAAGEDQTGKLATLRRLLQALGLVQPVGGRLTVSGADKGRIPEFWTLDETAQITALTRAWQALNRVEGMDANLGQIRLNTASARLGLLMTLKDQGQGAWVDTDDLLETLREKDLGFLFTDRRDIERRSGGYYYSNQNYYYYGSPATLVKLMDQVEPKFVRGELAGLPFQYGLVELGYTADAATWSAARLSDLGFEALSRLATLPNAALVPVAEADHNGRVVIQPNFQILAIGPVSLATLVKLDTLAERRKADVSAFEYHLSRDSVYRAQQAGMSTPEVTALLKDVSGGDLPQNVQRSLDEWAAHHERIVFRSGVSLLQTANETTLEHLLRGSPGASLERALTSEVALVKHGADHRLIEDLAADGLMPAVSGLQPASADHSITIDAEGHIAPVHAVPSLLLSGRLARVADPDDNGNWAITPQSVRRAGGDRQRVLVLLSDLERLNRGPLPAALVEKVKTWGSYYGGATTETLTLIEFADQIALNELSQDTVLRQWLTPFRATDRALAIVATDKLADVEARLAELGVSIQPGISR